MSRRSAKSGAFQEPKQARTRKQLARILDTADLLFGERGYEGTRLADIAAAVPCSMSTIYDRFASKEALLHYMHRQGTERAIAMIETLAPTGSASTDPRSAGAEAAAVGDLREVLPGALRIGFELIHRFRGRRRAVLERMHADPVLWELELELREALVDAGKRFLLAYRNQFRHPEPELAAAQAMHLMMRLTEDRHTPLPVPEPLQLDDDAFIQEACRMVWGYLGVEPTP